MAVPNRPTSGAPIETAWGDLVHDTIVSQDLQGAIASVTTTSGQTVGSLAVVFPRPFASAPLVVLGINFASDNYAVRASSVTASGMTIAVSPKTGGNFAASNPIPISWLAYGPRA